MHSDASLFEKICISTAALGVIAGVWAVAWLVELSM